MLAQNFSGCESCNGRCCHHYLVPVTGYDAWFIASELHLSMEQFLILSLEQERAPTGFQLDRTGATYILTLNTQQSTQDQKPCIFLLTLPYEYSRCSIYSHRPLVCQTFPAMLHHGSVDIREDVVCPKGAWNLATMNLPAWRLNLLRMEMETAIYRLVVRQWNECVEEASLDISYSPLQYFAYLMNAYSRLETLRHSKSKDEMAVILRTWGQQIAAEEAQKPWLDFLDHVQETLTEFSGALQ